MLCVCGAGGVLKCTDPRISSVPTKHVWKPVLSMFNRGNVRSDRSSLPPVSWKERISVTRGIIFHSPVSKSVWNVLAPVRTPLFPESTAARTHYRRQTDLFYESFERAHWIYKFFLVFFVGVENNRMRCPMGSIAFCVLRTALEMMSRIIGFMKLVCLCARGFCTHTRKPLADLIVDCDCN